MLYDLQGPPQKFKQKGGMKKVSSSGDTSQPNKQQNVEPQENTNSSDLAIDVVDRMKIEDGSST